MEAALASAKAVFHTAPVEDLHLTSRDFCFEFTGSVNKQAAIKKNNWDAKHFCCLTAMPLVMIIKPLYLICRSNK